MAANDLSKLQDLLKNAEDNELVLNQVRKSMDKVRTMLDEMSAILDPAYKPERKERKPRAASTTGGRRGRPKKDQSAA
ncbi:hypothetical protein SAMN02745146_2651 [Hymenobacter daecheongensis DSM 21074]|uniref:Uncharacterized protein n=1 Tax=Hymenobacter daecheongensis DSM 21074 TaxID=1121955 RepID=A0A1M6HUT4_9BACT|nr:hypothetical protein [Hymenobacter daecheongensis]SHJ25953.1 hypothetical protein SAMN02745146_2651 [Hymenobacter daecheongensis DSM 21074]